MTLAYFFFVTIMVTGHVFLQALLTALLLKNFEATQSEEAKNREKKKLEKLQTYSMGDDDDFNNAEEPLSVSKCSEKL